MALQTLQGGLWVPDPPQIVHGLTYQASSNMNASGDKFAWIFQVPATGVIKKIGFRPSTATAVVGTLSLGLYTVSSGAPTASVYGGTSDGVPGAPASGAWQTVALGSDCNATAGDIVAAVLSYSAFTSATTLTLTTMGGGSDGRTGFPFNTFFNGASWANDIHFPVFSIEYATTTYNYIGGTFPISAITNQSFNSGTALKDEYALSFQMPFPCRLAGGCVFLQTAASGDFEIDLYDNTANPGSSTLKSISFSAINFEATGLIKPLFFSFTSGQSLTANTNYRLSIRPTSANAIILPLMTYPLAQALDQMSGGQLFRLTTRVDQGAWAADTTTQRPCIYLLFDQFDDAVSTGGMIQSRVFTGF